MFRKLLISSLLVLFVGMFVGLVWSADSPERKNPTDTQSTSQQADNLPKRRFDPGVENLPPARSTIGITGSIGFVVNEVFPGTPADQAGLQPGDVIHSVEGVQFGSLADFLMSYSQVEPGTKVLFTVLRKTESGMQVYNVSVPTTRPQP